MLEIVRAVVIMGALAALWGVVDRRWTRATGREQRGECGNCGCGGGACERKAHPAEEA